MTSSILNRYDSSQILTEGLKLPPIQDDQVTKMLFLSTKPDEAFTLDVFGGCSDETSIMKSIDKIQKALTEKKMDPIRRALHVKLHFLKEHNGSHEPPVSVIESNFSDYEDMLSEEEEDILIFTEIFKNLSLPVPGFLEKKFNDIVHTKKIPIQKGQEDEEIRNNFVYTENKVLSEVCDLLNPKDVCSMYSFVRRYEKDYSYLKDVFNVVIEEGELTATSGLKDAAFYFLILHMIDKQLLNRLYTHSLEGIIQGVRSKYKEEGINEDFSRRFDRALELLRRYPVSSYPPGLCLIFHMDKGRPGADNDVIKVKELFEKYYGYHVFQKRDPKKKDIQDIATKLSAQRNKFYDSLVIWFMGHGSHSSLTVSDGNIHRRKDFIELFLNVDWLKKKPKLFFIQACATRQPGSRISNERRRSIALEAVVDSSSLGLGAGDNWVASYGDYVNTSEVNNFADTLIAYATNWNEPASRGECGSLYVQTVVDQLKEHGHNESIENVLRKIHYNTGTVLLQTEDCKEWKQTPYYECSLRKEFVFPKRRISKAVNSDAVNP